MVHSRGSGTNRADERPSEIARMFRSLDADLSHSASVVGRRFGAISHSSSSSAGSLVSSLMGSSRWSRAAAQAR